MRKLILIKVCEALADEYTSIYFFFFCLSLCTHLVNLTLLKTFSTGKILEVTFNIRNVSCFSIAWNALWGFSSSDGGALSLRSSLFFKRIDGWGLLGNCFLLLSQYRVQNHLLFRIISHEVPLEMEMNNGQGGKARILYCVYIKDFSLLIKSYIYWVFSSACELEA